MGKRAAELQNEQHAKAQLANAMNEARRHADHAIDGLEQVLEVLRLMVDSLPEEVDADDLDLESVVTACKNATDEGLDRVDVATPARLINTVAKKLSEAGGEIEYLLAGDFSE